MPPRLARTPLVLPLLLLACGDAAPPAPRPDAAGTHAEVVDWVRTAHVPLTGVEAGRGLDDLRRLDGVLAGARVVALGEATHGTREFFQLKHRMFEYLVEVHGFSAFLFEANFSEALAADRYVTTGEGDPAAALAGMYFWTWDTQEVLALLEWMRAYNADPAHVRKLRFYGTDVQFSAGPARAVREHLAQVDPALLEEVRGWLTPLVETPRGPATDADPARVRELRARMEAARAAHEAVAGAQAHRWALRHLRTLEQYLELRLSGDLGEVRDRAMAENTLWLLEEEGPQARVAVWAHNFHVSREHPRVTQGRVLAEALGPALYVFGFAFGQGDFRVVRLDAPGGSTLAEGSVARLPQSTLGETLRAGGGDLLALDLRGLPAGSAAAQYFQGWQSTWELGAGFRVGMEPSRVLPAARYDGLLYVDTSTPARGNPRP